MRLLRLRDADINPLGQVFYYSRVRASLLLVIVLGGGLTLLFRSVAAQWKLGYYIGGVVLLFASLMRRFVTARFRPSNWLARMTDTGLLIQFRSYLNYHLPADDLTVVSLSYDEIKSARSVRESAKVLDARGGAANEIRHYVELELSGDIQPLAKALQAELVEKAPVEKRWYGASSTLYGDHPVRLSPSPYLRLRWQVVPPANVFLEALRPHARIADPASTAEDLAHLQALSRSEQERRLRELKARGENVAAIEMARRIYGCGIEQARTIVEAME